MKYTVQGELIYNKKKPIENFDPSNHACMQPACNSKTNYTDCLSYRVDGNNRQVCQWDNNKTGNTGDEKCYENPTFHTTASDMNHCHCHTISDQSQCTGNCTWSNGSCVSSL